MVTGRVVRFDEARGYGFVAPDDGGEDVFVHANELLDDKSQFVVGAGVEFELGTGERGPKASRVRVVRPAPARPSDGARPAVSSARLLADLTEVLIDAAPTLTGAEIAQVRQRLLAMIRERRWVDLRD